MAYSKVGIVNLGLQRIGVGRISSLTEESEPARSANAVYDYIRDEVLSAKDWVFAKTRATLTKNSTTPVYTYDYAYALPEGFLRLCKQNDDNPPVYPTGYAYAVETLPDETLVLVTNYDNSDDDLYIKYIKRVTNVQKYTPTFINAFAFRIGAELCIGRTESTKKYEFMISLYKEALIQAEGINQSGDYVENEAGDDSWETAGR